MRPVDPPFVRPLLPFSRDELVAWLAGEGIAWREDASNFDPAFTRNRVRHELLPMLESFNPAIRLRLNELCRQLADDEADWAARVEAELRRYKDSANAECRLPCAVLTAASAAMAGRLVRGVLQHVRGDLRRLEAGHVAAILALAGGKRSQGEVHLPGAWVGRRYELLWFRREPPVRVPIPSLVIEAPGHYPLGDGRILSVALSDLAAGEGTSAVEFCRDLVPFPLQVRTPHPGDRIQPAGMTGNKKLQDLFVDLKLPVEARAAAVLICAGDRVLWVAGIRRCEGLHPAPGRAVLRLELFDGSS
jgi:tRNA(Ile)-lysidine synthase